MIMQNNVSLVSTPVAENIHRSKMVQPFSHHTTMNNFEWTPIFLDMGVMPGDTIKMRMSTIIRMLTPIAPVMDQATATVAFFAVPYRLVWDHAKEFFGEDSNTYWQTPTEYSIPLINPPSGGWNVGSLADHLGVPSGIGGSPINALPFRAVALIWNEWMRAESITQPISFSTGDATVNGTNAGWSSYITDGALGGHCPRAARFHDIFTSSLMAPQAGAPVAIPLVGDGYAPVFAMDTSTGAFPPPITTKSGDNLRPLKWGKVALDSSVVPNTWKLSGYIPGSAKNNVIDSIGQAEASNLTNTPTVDATIAPMNLWADFNDAVGSSVTITALRQAFAVQRLLEAVNRGGSRYTEIIRTCFHVLSPDSRLQRPELLGIREFPISMVEINQTSSTDTTSPLGHAGATSKTYDQYDDYFTRSFTEHTIVIGLMCIRNNNDYSQGIDPFFRARTRWDFYWPQLNGISDQAVPNSSIYWQSDSVVDSDGIPVNDLPFGYQEAFTEKYRQKRNTSSGLMRTYVNQTLGTVWTYGTKFNSLPVLSTDFLYPDGSEIRSTLAVQNQPDFKVDCYFSPTYVRPMPLFSVPGMSRL